ncbi:sigma-70 family RNA polymerase sigma factor [Kitasatospora sp. CM 4170]|uniref:Sigma-70 family RNA polymerase sigma factor n=1 Tax=Kitasatospora aburaviensis TaxID=67265 RepID=A0ABW1ERF0_9ACTN|nr:sigma-70 family RNA polymerase sigma factor [Kitasatospora sp. CM 4170]WNM48554.1 sigma-70 family RNA polymerase sigma factor [Kitasatospora sp. CM 4170]
MEFVRQRRGGGRPEVAAGARPSEQGPSEQGLSEQGLSEQGLSEQGLSEQGLSEQGPSEQGPSEQGPSERGPSERDRAERDRAECDPPGRDRPAGGRPECGGTRSGPDAPRSGSAEAADFDRAFTEMLPRLHRAAVSLTGNPFAAGDIVHDAYLRIARRPERFLGHPQPYAYAFTTMANILRDQWRRERRRPVAPDPPEGARVDAEPCGGGLGELQAHWEVVRLLGRLTVKQARVLLLVDIGGYSIDEAATLLGVHRSTLAVTRRRALRHLRTFLERERAGGGGSGGESGGRAVDAGRRRAGRVRRVPAPPDAPS